MVPACQRDFTSIFMKIKVFSKPHKGFYLRRTLGTLKVKTRGERCLSKQSEKDPFIIKN
jgi:hypothetical protein